MGRLDAREFTLDHDTAFRLLLQDAGGDPVMMGVQHEFLDRVYWDPSERAAKALGIKTALGGSVVYDRRVHGSWRRIRDRTNTRLGASSAVSEKKWVQAYVTERDAWLRNHSNPILPKTVYRMEEFAKLIKDKKWALPLPLKVRGVAITKAIASGSRVGGG